jgi:hypothetical protein
MLIKGLFIDVVKKEIKEVVIENNLDSIYELLGCSIIESGYPQLLSSANHVLFCDEEGLLKDSIGCFKIFDYEPISGNAVIFSTDEEGDIQSHYLVVEKIKEIIQFVDVSELPEPKIEVFTWEEFNAKMGNN